MAQLLGVIALAASAVPNGLDDALNPPHADARAAKAAQLEQHFDQVAAPQKKISRAVVPSVTKDISAVAALGADDSPLFGLTTRPRADRTYTRVYPNGHEHTIGPFWQSTYSVKGQGQCVSTAGVSGSKHCHTVAECEARCNSNPACGAFSFNSQEATCSEHKTLDEHFVQDKTKEVTGTKGTPEGSTCYIRNDDDYYDESFVDGGVGVCERDDGTTIGMGVGHKADGNIGDEKHCAETCFEMLYDCVAFNYDGQKGECYTFAPGYVGKYRASKRTQGLAKDFGPAHCFVKKSWLAPPETEYDDALAASKKMLKDLENKCKTCQDAEERLVAAYEASQKAAIDAEETAEKLVRAEEKLAAEQSIVEAANTGKAEAPADIADAKKYLLNITEFVKNGIEQLSVETTDEKMGDYVTSATEMVTLLTLLREKLKSFSAQVAKATEAAANLESEQTTKTELTKTLAGLKKKETESVEAVKLIKEKKDQLCKPSAPDANTCTCTNGEPATGAACPTNGEAICNSCEDGYTLYGNQCKPNKCMCTNGEAATGAACPGDHQARCKSCEDGYHLDGNHCQPNKCMCTNGEAATGADCMTDGAQACASCESGFLGVNCQAAGTTKASAVQFDLVDNTDFSDRCLDEDLSGSFKLSYRNCHPGANQRFYLEEGQATSPDQPSRIRSAQDDKCLESEGDDGNLYFKACNEDFDNQRFYFERIKGYKNGPPPIGGQGLATQGLRMRRKGSDKCATYHRGDDRFYMDDCSQEWTQKFRTLL